MSVRARWTFAIFLVIVVAFALIWPHVTTLFARPPLLLQNPALSTKELWFSANSRFLFALGGSTVTETKEMGLDLRRWDLKRPGSPPDRKLIYYRCLTEDLSAVLHTSHDPIKLPLDSHILTVAISSAGDRIAWSVAGKLHLAGISWEEKEGGKKNKEEECAEMTQGDRTIGVASGEPLAHLVFLGADNHLLTFDSAGSLEKISTSDFKSFDSIVAIDVSETPFSIKVQDSFAAISSQKKASQLVRLASVLPADAGTNLSPVNLSELSQVLPLSKTEALGGTKNGLLVRILAPQSLWPASTDWSFENASRVSSGPESKEIRWIQKIRRFMHPYYLTAGEASKIYFTDKDMAPLQGLVSVPWHLTHFAANNNWIAFVSDRQLFLSKLAFAPRLDEQGKFLVGFCFSILGLIGLAHQLSQDRGGS